MPKTKLCAVSDLGPGGIKGITVGDGLEQMRFILISRAGQIKCYVNECPHMGTPLDTFPDRFLDESGNFLICSTHGARFRVDDGLCVMGPCKGQGLVSREILIESGIIFLAHEKQAEY